MLYSKLTMIPQKLISNCDDSTDSINFNSNASSSCCATKNPFSNRTTNEFLNTITDIENSNLKSFNTFKLIRKDLNSQANIVMLA